MLYKAKIKMKKAKDKNRNIKFWLAFLPFTFYLLPCFAQPVSSTELINNAREYDGKMVSYEGEVIGDIMARGQSGWVNVNDGKNAIGIWLDASLLKEVSFGGRYKTKGDIIEVAGIFQRACLEHGGDLDIHAQGIQKKISGRQIVERVNLNKRNLALILAGVLCLVWILQLLRHR